MIPPSFASARVGATGEAVFAGRGEPGSTISVLLRGEPIGQSTVSARGDWSLVIDHPLSSGALEMNLKADRPGSSLRSEEAILIHLTGSGTTPLVLDMRFGRPSWFLQRPDDLPRAPLSVDNADYDTGGGLSISGCAAPGSSVRLYLDNQPIGDAPVGDDGAWTFRPASVAPGAYTLRLDQLGLKALVVARIEVPFERADAASVSQSMLGEETLAVQPGESLWRIARASPGLGFQYAVLYRASQDQVRDPNLIYPGQVFEAVGGPNAR
jgi:hypothetical protein